MRTLRYQPDKVLTEVSEASEAMRDFTELGSDSKISMRPFIDSLGQEFAENNSTGFIEFRSDRIYILNY